MYLCNAKYSDMYKNLISIHFCKIACISNYFTQFTNKLSYIAEFYYFRFQIGQTNYSLIWN